MAIKFNKRIYKSWRDFFADVSFLARKRKLIRRVTRGGLLSSDFRERLMLAATAVYGCRYCSYLHTREALKSGLPKEEVVRLLTHSIESCPEEEVVALFYAQHWAESNAQPEADAVQRLEQIYGSEKAEAINLVLRMIRLGNLAGNSCDYLLYRISFGRWGR